MKKIHHVFLLYYVLWYSRQADTFVITLSKQINKAEDERGCRVNEKIYEYKKTFITADCSKMCVCLRTWKKQFITCLPLCPASNVVCKQNETLTPVQKIYSFNPPCYCPTYVCAP
ncbi:uncharacterized protein LOC130655520 isoform X2 [Hydractinia symbiolongicarpus]|uniref:uncharacterized protein LOC130655520 isoform X2 n=1 Tax=Hydractinia symbiolongicarpus TaxID=13093 RepID=UPI0025517C39|nr:uncharacterized protein LOC130655520 isoform X2 [Hydractinia symbiolongicarpus]